MVGVGPGSICTTWVVTGWRVPQLTAILEAYGPWRPGAVIATADPLLPGHGEAPAAGAPRLMMGPCFAGTGGVPTGQAFLLEGRALQDGPGMGSLSAMEQGSADRYFQDGSQYPEAAEDRGAGPYKGPLDRHGLSSSSVAPGAALGTCGAATLE